MFGFAFGFVLVLESINDVGSFKGSFKGRDSLKGGGSLKGRVSLKGKDSFKGGSIGERVGRCIGSGGSGPCCVGMW